MVSIKVWMKLSLLLFMGLQFLSCLHSENNCLMVNISQSIIDLESKMVLLRFVTNNTCAPGVQIDNIFLEESSNTKEAAPRCKIHHENGFCVGDDFCFECRPKQHAYAISVSSSPKSSTLNWTLEVEFTHSKNKDIREITFTHVKDLVLAVNESKLSPTDHVINGSEVRMTCIFEPGSSDDTATMTLNDVELNTTLGNQSNGSLRHISYVINEAQCRHNGLVTCSVAGQNLTRNLTIRCPPQIVGSDREFGLSAEGHLDVEFDVMRYSSSALNCSFVRVQEKEDIEEEMLHTPQCRRFNGRVINEPWPVRDKIYFRLTNVTSHSMVGQWRLTVQDDFGSDAVNFTISTNILAETESVDLPVGFWEGPNLLILIFGAPLALGTFVCLSILFFYKLRYYKSQASVVRDNGSQRQTEDHRLVRADLLYRGSNVSLMITNDIYEDSGDFVHPTSGCHEMAVGASPITVDVGTKRSDTESSDYANINDVRDECSWVMTPPSRHQSHDQDYADGRLRDDPLYVPIQDILEKKRQVCSRL